jgi:hypothetical protein
MTCRQQAASTASSRTIRMVTGSISRSSADPAAASTSTITSGP